MQFNNSIFIFRRDLRLSDNLALNEALKRSKAVLPVFIFDPRQLAPHPYRSEPGLEFMFNSLEELNLQLQKRGGRLNFLHGIAEEVIINLIKKCPAGAVFCSKDYTPFSLARDKKIGEICHSLGAKFYALPNILLNEPEAIETGSGGRYTIFSPFYKKCGAIPVAEPCKLAGQSFSFLPDSGELAVCSTSTARKTYLKTSNADLYVKGGRKEALSLLSRIKNLKDYKEIRNFPALTGTTGLSAHNKFGTISIREFYHSISTNFGKEHTICSELFWRDFFTHIGYNFPHVFEKAFNRKYQDIEWQNNPDFLQAWKEGNTGFPIIDAGMRELNATGFMHNRVRMIVASFLTKDLLLDWHHGEKYFAGKLLDFDPAVNNGNWQWAASTGCDAQPYFRIFNPWLQQEKFDSEARYIKRWVPELEGLNPKQIHQLYKTRISGLNYAKPIVNHDEQKSKALKLFEILN